jgi:hypothetical protein
LSPLASSAGNNASISAVAACPLCGAASHSKAACPVLGLTLGGEAGGGDTAASLRAGPGKGGKGGRGKGGRGGAKSGDSLAAAAVAAAALAVATTAAEPLAVASIERMLRSPSPKALAFGLSRGGSSSEELSGGAAAMQTSPGQGGKEGKASPKQKAAAAAVLATVAAEAAAGADAATADAATEALPRRGPTRPRAKVCLVLAPSEGLDHDTGPDHQESARRLHVLTGGRGGGSGSGGGSGGGGSGALRRPSLAPLLQWVPCQGPSTQLRAQPPCHDSNNHDSSRSSSSAGAGVSVHVSDADLLRVHDWDYLLHLRRQCAAAERATHEWRKLSNAAKSAAAPSLPPGAGNRRRAEGNPPSLIPIFDTASRFFFPEQPPLPPFPRLRMFFFVPFSWVCVHSLCVPSSLSLSHTPQGRRR